jgi:hypothetical protein
MHQIDRLAVSLEPGCLFADAIDDRRGIATDPANRVRIAFKADPVSPTRGTPRRTWSADLICTLILLVAFSERGASSRTSWATTAKPLPARICGLLVQMWKVYTLNAEAR